MENIHLPLQPRCVVHGPRPGGGYAFICSDIMEYVEKRFQDQQKLGMRISARGICVRRTERI